MTLSFDFEEFVSEIEEGYKKFIAKEGRKDQFVHRLLWYNNASEVLKRNPHPDPIVQEKLLQHLLDKKNEVKIELTNMALRDLRMEL